MKYLIASLLAARVALAVGAAHADDYKAAIVDDIHAEDDCPYAIIIDDVRYPLRDFTYVDSGPVCLY